MLKKNYEPGTMARKEYLCRFGLNFLTQTDYQSHCVRRARTFYLKRIIEAFRGCVYTVMCRTIIILNEPPKR